MSNLFERASARPAMGTPAFYPSNFARSALQFIALFLIVVIAMMTVRSAQASGSVAPSPQAVAKIAQFRPSDIYMPGGCGWYGPVGLQGDIATTATQACMNGAKWWNARPDLNAWCTNAFTSNWGAHLFYMSDDGTTCNFHYCGLAETDPSKCTGTSGHVQSWLACPAGYTVSGSTCHPCPANSTGTPITNPTSCTCNSPTAANHTNYVPDAAGTKCIPEPYTIALSGLGGEVMPTKTREAYAKVTKSDGSAKSGAYVDLVLTVVPENGDPVRAEHVGGISPNGGSTGADGKLSFVFTAPVAGGTHTITATCTNCTNQATGTMRVPGCGVPELRKVEDIPPNGPDVLPLTLRLEATLGADLALLPDAQAGVTCITNKYPSASISSGTRTEAYQAHLKEIWDKSEELDLPKNKNNAACKPLRDKVNAAKGCSGGHCIVFPPAEVSDHPTGKAFDVSRDTINGLRRTLRPALPPGTPPLTEEQQHQADIKLIADWLASPAACNLVWGGSYGDIVHFSIP